MNTLVKEKKPVREFAIEEQKKYEFEKNLQKSATHIFLKKESEFTSVNRIINKFAKISGMEFYTFFKMYKFQNYAYSPAYYKGTSYKYGSLNCFSSYIKAATNNLMPSKVNGKVLSSSKLIYDFIQEVKNFSSPFPYIFNIDEGKKGIRDLLDSGTLTQEEVDFVLSAISTGKPGSSDYERSARSLSRSNKKVEKTEKVEKVAKEAKMAKKTKQFLSEQDLLTIVNNYKLGTKVVSALLPKHNKKTLYNYIRSCRLMEQNIVPQKVCPNGLIECFNKVKNKKLPLNSSKVLACEQKSNRKTQKLNITNPLESYIIMDSLNNVHRISDNEMFLRGFLEGSKDNSLKLFKIVELK